MHKRLTNENGSTLVLSVFLILFISIIGLSLLRTSSNSLKQVDHELTDQAVYYVAEAGLNVAKEAIKQDFDKIEKQALQELKAFLENASRLNPEVYYTEADIQNKYNIILSDYFGRTDIDTQEKTLQLTDNKTAVITYTKDEASRSILIQSVGMIDDAKTRTLQQYVQLESKLFDPPPPPQGGGGGGTPQNPNPTTPPPAKPNPLDTYSAIATGNITLSGGAKIIGSAGSLGGTINLSGGASISGDISVSNDSQLDHPNWMDIPNTIVPALETNVNDFLPEFPKEKFNELEQLNPPANLEIQADKGNKTNIINNGDFNATSYIANNYTLNLTTDTKFDSFNVNQNNILNINIGSNEINLYIEQLNITQGHINIIGSGTLNLYVKDFKHLKGSFNKNGNPAQVNLYYNGTDKLSFNSETQFYGSLINDTADVTLSGGAGVYGNILSGGTSISISGGVNTNGQYIVAPNANLKLTGGGDIKGTVLTKSIDASGGTSITFGIPVVPLPPKEQTETQAPIVLPKEPTTDIKERSVVEI